MVAGKWGMKTHLLNVHGIVTAGDRLYECPECDRVFLSRLKCQEHVNSHSGLKPYACPMCETRCVKFANLKVHVKRLHFKDIRLVDAEKFEYEVL
jgi:ribosomal protein L37AE/L43A